MTLAVQNHDERRIAIAAIHASIALWRATDCARGGRYADAEALLNEPRIQPRTPAVLDLLARISAQQGRLTEAEAHWKEASLTDPANDSFRACLDRIATLQRRTGWLRGWVLTLAGATVITIAVVMTTRTIDPSSDPLKGAVENVSPVTTATPVALAPSKEEPPFDLVLSIPGAVVEKRGVEAAVAFPFGLFIGGTRLKPEAKKALDAFGQQLATAPASLAVTVVGFTDDLPIAPWSRYRDNADLGLARALVALSYLRQTTSIDSHIFLLRTAGAGDPLTIPNANGLDRRTVEFRISRGRR